MHGTASRIGGTALAGLCLAVMPTVPASADGFEDLQYIVTPDLMMERARRVREAVQLQARWRLAPGRPALGETALPYASSDGLHDGVQAIHGLGDDVRAQEQDAAAIIEQRWSVWGNGTYTHLDDDLTGAGYEGYQAAGLGGLDAQITERILVGLLGSVDHSDIDNTILPDFPSSSETDGRGAGAYAGITLTDNLVLDGSFLYTWIDNSAVDALSTASYDSERWNVNGNLTGYWFIDALRLSPALGVSYTAAREEAYADSLGMTYPSLTQRTGVFNFGGQTGYTFFFGDVQSAELWVGSQGEWTFERSPSAPASVGVPVRDDDLDVRAQGGLNLTLSPAFSISLSGDVSGLAIDDYLAVGGSGQASIRF
jgi:outer membrane autotransporter protein